jgi:ATP-dependent Lon protease
MSTIDGTTQRSYPLLPLRNVLVFPGTTVSLEVARPKSVRAVELAQGTDMAVVMCSQSNTDIGDPLPEHIYPVGTLGTITEIAKSASGNLRIVVEGVERVKINSYISQDPAYIVTVTKLKEGRIGASENELLVKSLVEQYEEYVRTTRNVPPETLISLSAVTEAGRLCDTIAGHIPLAVEAKQEILETVSVTERAEKVIEILSNEMEIAGLEKRINARVRKQIEKSQREYWLREQMKAIQKELGERDDDVNEAEEFRRKIEEAGLVGDVREKALREVERLEKMPQASAEAVVSRTYLEWLVSLPWNVLTEDTMDIERAQKILDEDHYGLEQVKERILEYLAIRQLVDRPKGPILCFVGPPGVGKTSLGKSIARALDRKFVRISLGGIRDEAEIRGHRRTYIGALPGRVIQGMRNAGSRNPVFLMDEVDKMASDFRGDPAAALLEVLDPEQNHQFSDHYLEVPFDLSKVMFITTANSTYSIPRALLDRMEVINLPGYTEEEKIEIASRFLIPKMLKEHGLTSSNLTIRKDATKEIIRSYTREAGVRNLERQIAAICRKTAKDVVSGKKHKVTITPKNLSKYLGVPRFYHGQAEKEDQVGVALALGVTDYGGDVMSIEVSIVEGKGNLTLTGHLGEVMKESAQAAVSYLRSKSADLGLSPRFYETIDIHVHVPEGAIPKDGPSAGITIACAIASALMNKPVRHDVAMSGEITLRGRVLPVGGIKEKVLAAHRAGISKVILPVDNKKDLEDIPESILEDITIELVGHMDEVFLIALTGVGQSDLGALASVQGMPKTENAVVNNID